MGLLQHVKKIILVSLLLAVMVLGFVVFVSGFSLTREPEMPTDIITSSVNMNDPQRLNYPQIEVPVSSVSNEIASFVFESVKNYREFTKIPNYIRCDVSMKYCAPMQVATHTPVLGFVVPLLKNAEDKAMQSLGDDLLTQIVEFCSQEEVFDENFCVRNFEAIYDAYLETQDPTYYNILTNYYGNIFLKENLTVESQYGAKLVYLAKLYEVTKDPRYAEPITKIADWYLDDNLTIFENNSEVYRTNSFVIYQGMLQLPFLVLIPAYRVSGDTKYLDLTKLLLKQFNLPNNVHKAWINPDGPINTIAAVAAMVALSEIDSENMILHQTQALQTLEAALYYHWDSSRRPGVTGDGGVFTELNIKTVNINAWFALLLNSLKDRSVVKVPVAS